METIVNYRLIFHSLSDDLELAGIDDFACLISQLKDINAPVKSIQRNVVTLGVGYQFVHFFTHEIK
jgi:hypothetical protein